MLVNTFLASLAAKLTMATGLAVATVTGAGAAGILPEPAQKVVASAVEATTPFSIPNASAAVDDVVDDVDEAIDEVTTTTLGTSTTLPGSDGGEAEGDGTTDGARKQNHGACVSTVAKNTPGGPDKGKTVSSVARSDCGKKSETTSTTVAPTTTSSTTVTTIAPTTSSTVAGTAATSASSGKGNRGDSGNSGKGNSGRN